MKSKILYVGNKLMKHGYNPTSIETLGERLKADHHVFQTSSQKIYALRLLDMWFTIFKYRKQVKAVVIDTYGSRAFHYAWTSARVCRWLKLKYIPILRGGELPLRIKKDEKISRSFAQNAHVLIAPSGFLAESFRQFTDKVMVIPNFIDLANYPFKQRTAMDQIRILWVRSMQGLYQPELAVEVVHELKKQGLDVSMAMVGPDKDGSLAVCQALAKTLDVEQEVTFTGRLAKEDWIALSANYDVFLNTTSVDNTPVSVMEGMALGMPVVTTKVGGIPFLFEDGVEGVMVPEQTAQALARAIADFQRDPDRMKEISTAAREKAKAWDWPVVREQWNTVLNAC